VLKSVGRAIRRGLLHFLDRPKRLPFLGEPAFWLTGFRQPDCHTRTPASVAVIKLDRLGDVVLCSHFLTELRRAWPESGITLFVRESLVDLARHCRAVDEVIGVPVDEARMLFSDPYTGEYRHWEHHLTTWLKQCHDGRFWERRFEAALVPRWDTDFYGAVPLAYLLGARQRWGVT
jgi:hypothetical protein